MRKSIVQCFACAIALALAIPSLAGGFFLVLGNPEASPAARRLNAVLTIRAAGCGNPNDARITAAAVGAVNGERREIPLKLEPAGEPGFYAVTRQWPAEGRWVLRFVGTDHDRVTHTLVPAGPDGVHRASAKFAMTRPADSDVDRLLEAGQ